MVEHQLSFNVSYSRRNRLIPVASLKAPLSSERFAAAAGFVRPVHGGSEILIPSAQFQREFPDYGSIMQDLRAAGLAKTEGGENPKLTIKAPQTICLSGRVYCIRLGSPNGESHAHPH